MTHASLFSGIVPQVALRIFETIDNKREALLVCMGFKTGEAYVCAKYGINE